MKSHKALFLLLGPVLFVLAILFLPGTIFTMASRAAIGTLIWMAIWWIGLPVEPAVTSLIPILTNALFNMTDMSKIISQYMSETTLLVFAAFIVSQTWGVTKLDKRLALKALSLIGPSVKQQAIAWFLFGVVFSTIFPNLLVGIMALPIAFSMLKYCGEIEDESGVSKSKAASLILTASIWGTYVGGMGTPLGGSMNMVVVSYFEQYTGHEFMYINWFLRLLPLLVCISLVSICVLTFIAPKDIKLNGTKEYFKRSYRELPPISRAEIISALLFFVPVLMSFLRPYYAALFPGLKNAYVFLLAAFITFFIKKEDKEPLLTWKGMEKKFSWGLLFMLSSGLALGKLLTETQTIDVIAGFIRKAGISGKIEILLLFVVFSIVIAEISNSIVSASLSIPIIITVTQGMGIDPIPFIYVDIAALNSAFMMPTAVRSMPVGYGVEPKFIMKNGLFLSVGVVVVATLVGYFLIELFPGFMNIA